MTEETDCLKFKPMEYGRWLLFRAHAAYDIDTLRVIKYKCGPFTKKLSEIHCLHDVGLITAEYTVSEYNGPIVEGGFRNLDGEPLRVFSGHRTLMLRMLVPKEYLHPDVYEEAVRRDEHMHNALMRIACGER